jgi:hypothetical protein
MSTEDSSAESREAPPPRRQRLRLIDIYTHKGAFSSNELTGIAAKARETTLSKHPANTEDELTIGEPSDESCGELSGEPLGRPSGEPYSNKESYPLENIETSALKEPTTSSTARFTVPPHDSPYYPPHDSPHGSPDNPPNYPPHGSPYYPPDTSPAIPLTENQATLYFCLKQLNGVITNLSRISQVTGISEHTLSLPDTFPNV